MEDKWNSVGLLFWPCQFLWLNPQRLKNSFFAVYVKRFLNAVISKGEYLLKYRREVDWHCLLQFTFFQAWKQQKEMVYQDWKHDSKKKKKIIIFT